MNNPRQVCKLFQFLGDMMVCAKDGHLWNKYLLCRAKLKKVKTTSAQRAGLQVELKYRTFANITVAIVVDGAHALEVVQAWVQN